MFYTSLLDVEVNLARALSGGRGGCIPLCVAMYVRTCVSSTFFSLLYSLIRLGIQKSTLLMYERGSLH